MTDRDRSISRAGNQRAHATLIQVAWLWLRYQPDSALATWFHERVGMLKGRTRRIDIVAMARKLLIALWRYVETGLIPNGVEIEIEEAKKAYVLGIAVRRQPQRRYGKARPSSFLGDGFPPRFRWVAFCRGNVSCMRHLGAEPCCFDRM